MILYHHSRAHANRPALNKISEKTECGTREEAEGRDWDFCCVSLHTMSYTSLVRTSAAPPMRDSNESTRPSSVGTSPPPSESGSRTKEEVRDPYLNLLVIYELPLVGSRYRAWGKHTKVSRAAIHRGYGAWVPIRPRCFART